MRTERMKWPLLILAAALLLSACGGSLRRADIAAQSATAAPAAPAAEQEQDPRLAEEAARNALTQGGTAPAQPPADGSTTDQQGFSRLVIKSAELSLQIENVRDAEAAVRSMVGTLGGYIVRVETNGADAQLSTRMTFRVPSNRFDEALSGVQGLAKKVLSQAISGDDVTEEFVDLESQLRNLEATRDRLLTFLERATKVEEALAVNSSLSEVQGQIEQIKGRMKYLKQSAAFSTISVSLLPVPALTPIVTEEGWQPIAVAREALRNLVELGQGLVNIVIVLAVWSPVWLLLLAGVWWARRKMARRSSAGA